MNVPSCAVLGGSHLHRNVWNGGTRCAPAARWNVRKYKYVVSVKKKWFPQNHFFSNIRFGEMVHYSGWDAPFGSDQWPLIGIGFQRYFETCLSLLKFSHIFWKWQLIWYFWSQNENVSRVHSYNLGPERSLFRLKMIELKKAVLALFVAKIVFFDLEPDRAKLFQWLNTNSYKI